MLNLVAQRHLRLVARLPDGHLAEIVRERLARPRDVAVHFGLDLVVGEGRVVPQELLRLLARPALRVDAGIHHQPRGAPRLVAQHAEGLVGRVIHTHLRAQPFAIKRPAFAVGVDIHLAEGGRFFCSILIGHLEGMAGRRLVQSQGGQAV